MYPLYFTAILKSKDGKLIEIGEACLSETPNTMDFNSEFVPLMRLGTPVEIVRVLDNEELEHFPGKVYRSTKKSLRLTDIPSKTIEAAKTFFEVNAHIPVSLALSPDGSLPFPEEKASRVGGNIRYLSASQIKITALEFVPESQIAAFDADAVSLKNLAVRVARRVSLGHNAAVLLCDILSSSPENLRALARFEASRQPQVRLL